MNRLIALLFFLLQMIGITAGHAAEATPSDVYAQAVRIEQEVEILRRHFEVTGKARFEAKTGDLKPRHTWAQSYVILLKLGKLRRKVGLSYIDPVGVEPTLDMPPTRSWSMTQRILNEIHIIKFYLDIPGQAPAAVPVSGKRTIDVFNKLHQISGELELLTDPATPGEVYSEAKRLNEDVDAVLRHLRIFEKAMPPLRRENLQAKDSLRAVFEVLGETQRIQRLYGMETTDFKGFDTGEKAVPDDVFGMVILALAEWQRVKAQIGMTHHITVPASYEENKAPADVVQLLGYIADKLRNLKPK